MVRDYISKKRNTFIISNINMDCDFQTRYYNGTITYSNRVLSIDSINAPCLYLYRKGDQFLLTSNPLVFYSLGLNESPNGITTNCNGKHIINIVSYSYDNVSLFEGVEQIWKWKEIEIPSFRVKKNDDMFTKPFSTDKADEWYFKWSERVRNDEEMMFDLSGGQDTRIMVSWWRERKSPTVIYGKDIKRYTDKVNDGLILHQVYEGEKTPYTNLINHYGDEYCSHFKGNGTCYCRMNSKLNNEMIHNITFNHFHSSLGFQDYIYNPFIDDLLLQMNYSRAGELHDYIFKTYCPDLVKYPFITYDDIYRKTV